MHHRLRARTRGCTMHTDTHRLGQAKEPRNARERLPPKVTVQGGNDHDRALVRGAVAKADELLFAKELAFINPNDVVRARLDTQQLARWNCHRVAAFAIVVSRNLGVAAPRRVCCVLYNEAALSGELEASEPTQKLR